MARPAPRRLHRLPQWTDYILIPAPLDLSLTEVAGKSPVPAVIVTPCSPSSSHDFSLAFLPKPTEPTLSERVQSYLHSTPGLRARYIFCLLIVVFVFVCHLFTHHMAVRHRSLDFSVESGDAYVTQTLLVWMNLWPKLDGKKQSSEPASGPVAFDHEIDTLLD